jgi:hypothetical protein
MTDQGNQVGFSYGGFGINIPWLCKTFSEELSLLKEAICENQGEYIQYSHRAHQLHKQLRIALHKDVDTDTLQHLMSELDNYLNNGLERSINKNFFYLEKLFLALHTHEEPPRICTKLFIKGVYDDNGKFVEDTSGGEFVYDLFRYRAGYRNAPFVITENTGFTESARDGTRYIENDIPKAVQHRKYKNSRLNDEQVVMYRRPWWESLPHYIVRYIARSKTDYEWQRCWKGYDSPERTCAPAEASYKSTLIIPVTLWNNMLDSNFKDSMAKDFGVPDFQRFIFAFLCFDHKNRKYFDHKQDVNIGYIFADIISLYFFRKWTLTRLSKVYQDAERQLNNQRGEQNGRENYESSRH